MPAECLLLHVGHGDSVSSLAFSNDGQLLASGSVDGTFQVWDVVGNHICTLEGPGGEIEVRKIIFLAHCYDCRNN